MLYALPLLMSCGLSAAGVWWALRHSGSAFGAARLTALISLVLLLLLSRWPAFNLALGQTLAGAWGEDTRLISSQNLIWLGFAYFILRLLSLLLEAQGPHPQMRGGEFLLYAFFPLTWLAGPIDRPGRFVANWRARAGLSPERFGEGGGRIALGLGKKFILADSLALIALSPSLAADVEGPAGAWLILYAYAWRLYWDFSGYSDIVIGLGKWAGLDLPENFASPYAQTNLAAFWSRWHMSLTDWFRAHVFLPLTRALLRRKWPLSEFLAGQLITMLLIGAWHGITPPFLLWGVWHALGLYGYHLWSNWSRPWAGRGGILGRLAAWAITFHYVCLGWVFFALPDLDSIRAFMPKLLGG
jgi:D-alanyl-lipoteichoic acid acyltransferase DltB (MBOAT superfamily)